MNDGFKRISSEEALREANKEHSTSQRGKLKIFIGYAPGVGKTYTMLNECNRRLKRGQDIVIGCLESHSRKETEEQIGDLQTIPRKKIQYNEMTLEEMDTDAVINRSPEAVIVDELAHTNVPGSK
ncbi:MAG: sensor histidine kinase KdpD, partial [Bacillota bacterium]|nr:sensor histidine kinase KdpD [Bacillota bacterium]